MDAALRHYQGLRPPPCKPVVSILVLVDAALRHIDKSSPEGLDLPSFNPCFSGCRPATRDSIEMAIAGLGFNPCFSGCRPATIFHRSHTAVTFGFNPCFSGCRPATGGRAFRFVPCVRVSILVLVDAALRL